MGLVKCPRCELNYMQDTDKYCTVCRREMKGEDDGESFEICSECGENRALPGEEMCIYCLKEIRRTEGANDEPHDLDIEGSVIGLTEASAMDEIELEVEDDSIPPSDFKEIDEELVEKEEAEVSLDEVLAGEMAEEDEE